MDRNVKYVDNFYLGRLVVELWVLIFGFGVIFGVEGGWKDSDWIEIVDIYVCNWEWL